MIYVFIIAVLLCFTWLASVSIVQASKHVLDNRKHALLDSRRTLSKAESTLRRIAAGSSEAAIEAQICLNDIDTYHERELN